MSALTEKVAREHQRIFNAQYGLGPHCICGWKHPGYDGSQKHVRHVAEVTEAAVRAAVAADIRALDDGEPRSPDALNIIDDAALIAEGKQP